MKRNILNPNTLIQHITNLNQVIDTEYYIYIYVSEDYTVESDIKLGLEIKSLFDEDFLSETDGDFQEDFKIFKLFEK